MKKTKNMILCALFSALIAIGAFIKIPLPPVPVTMQFLFISLAGLLLGPKYGFISVTVYIFTGLVGLPVFTQGGGISYILNPTFGYIIGFAAGAYIAGIISQKKSSFPRLFLACFSAIAVIYLIGSIYFYIISNLYLGKNIDVWTILRTCVIVFIPSDIISCIISAFIAKRMMPVISKIQNR